MPSTRKPNDKEVEIFLSASTTKTELKAALKELEKKLGDDFHETIDRVASNNSTISQALDMYYSNF